MNAETYTSGIRYQSLKPTRIYQPKPATRTLDQAEQSSALGCDNTEKSYPACQSPQKLNPGLSSLRVQSAAFSRCQAG